MKTKKQILEETARIKAGSFNIEDDSVNALLNQLNERGITQEHYEKVMIGFDYSGCYYEGDNPSIEVKWDHIL